MVARSPEHGVSRFLQACCISFIGLEGANDLSIAINAIGSSHETRVIQAPRYVLGVISQTGNLQLLFGLTGKLDSWYYSQENSNKTASIATRTPQFQLETIFFSESLY